MQIDTHAHRQAVVIRLANCIDQSLAWQVELRVLCERRFVTYPTECFGTANGQRQICQ
jgi:hypothetical protein